MIVIDEEIKEVIRMAKDASLAEWAAFVVSLAIVAATFFGMTIVLP